MSRPTHQACQSVRNVTVPVSEHIEEMEQGEQRGLTVPGLLQWCFEPTAPENPGAAEGGGTCDSSPSYRAAHGHREWGSSVGRAHYLTSMGMLSMILPPLPPTQWQHSEQTNHPIDRGDQGLYTPPLPHHSSKDCHLWVTPDTSGVLDILVPWPWCQWQQQHHQHHSTRDSRRMGSKEETLATPWRGSEGRKCQYQIQPKAYR